MARATSHISFTARVEGCLCLCGCVCVCVCVCVLDSHFQSNEVNLAWSFQSCTFLSLSNLHTASTLVGV